MDIPNEHARALAWRKSQGLTRKQLADRIGYCVSAIQNFENGYNNVTKAPINPNDMKRFRLCCASIAGRVDFDWGPVTIRLD